MSTNSKKYSQRIFPLFMIQSLSIYSGEILQKLGFQYFITESQHQYLIFNCKIDHPNNFSSRSVSWDFVTFTSVSHLKVYLEKQQKQRKSRYSKCRKNRQYACPQFFYQILTKSKTFMNQVKILSLQQKLMNFNIYSKQISKLVMKRKKCLGTIEQIIYKNSNKIKLLIVYQFKTVLKFLDRILIYIQPTIYQGQESQLEVHLNLVNLPKSKSRNIKTILAGIFVLVFMLIFFVSYIIKPHLQFSIDQIIYKPQGTRCYFLTPYTYQNFTAQYLKWYGKIDDNYKLKMYETGHAIRNHLAVNNSCTPYQKKQNKTVFINQAEMVKAWKSSKILCDIDSLHSFEYYQQININPPVKGLDCGNENPQQKNFSKIFIKYKRAISLKTIKDYGRKRDKLQQAYWQSRKVTLWTLYPKN